jgi:hypothetical protein
MERPDQTFDALMLHEPTRPPTLIPSRSELYSRLVERVYDMMGRMQVEIERAGPGNKGLRLGTWVSLSVTGKISSLQVNLEMERLDISC